MSEEDIFCVTCGLELWDAGSTAFDSRGREVNPCYHPSTGKGPYCVECFKEAYPELYEEEDE